MSATEFYLSKGYTPAFRSVVKNGASTLEVWTPTTSTRIVLTHAQVSTGAQSGTIAFYFGNLAGSKVLEFSLTSTETISPVFGPIEGTMYDRSLFAQTNPNGDGVWRINVQGFELE